MACHLMQLPPALAPWSRQLAMFPPDVALSLGPLLRRLGPALGSLSHPGMEAAGDVDGFDGLTHRGSYDRLLASDWLLADEAPEEFDRRAASGEHTFLRLARPEPDGSRASVALFDAGPSQLGSPRVVQLAALVVLARRAEAGGARFLWGILQQREASLFAGLDAGGVRVLLDARTAEEATAADLTAWQRRVGEPVASDDLWIVGSERLAASPASRAGSVLVVRDVLAPGSRRVAARVLVRSRPVAELDLELPAEPATARLLRDPFAAATATVATTSTHLPATSNLVFSATGNRLFLRAEGGGVVDVPLPNSPRMQVGQPRRHREPDRAVAVGRVGKTLVAVAARRDAYEVVFRPRPGIAITPGLYPPGDPDDDPASHPEAPLSACHWLRNPQGVATNLLFLDGTGRLLRLCCRGPEPRTSVVSSSVVAMVDSADGVTYVERAGDDSWRVVGLAAERRDALTLLGTGPVLLGSGRDSPDQGTLSAVGEGGGVFQVHGGRKPTRIVVPAGATPLELVANHRRRESGIVVLEEDRRSIVHCGVAWSGRLPVAGATISQIAVHAAGGLVAYTTTAGELTLYSLGLECVLHRLRFTTDGRWRRPD